MTDAEVEARALARNWRYLTEVVEEFGFCPFARRCRESGALDRRVLLAPSPAIDELEAQVAQLHRPEFAHIEIGLLILPRLAQSPQEWERTASRLRDAAAKAGHAEFFLVAFHPQAPFDPSTPDRLVPLLRRSPDPTLQLVRVATLDRVRRESTGTVWMSPKAMDLKAPLPEPARSLSERIGLANHETVRAATAERIAAILESIEKG